MIGKDKYFSAIINKKLHKFFYKHKELEQLQKTTWMINMVNLGLLKIKM